MIKFEFIAVKKTGHKPQFKELIGLIKSDNEGSYLSDFMLLNHDGKHTCITTQGDSGTVETVKGSYSYLLFKSHILRTDIYNETKILYKR